MNSSDGKVSIVVPVFNEVEILRRTVSEILHHVTMTGLEHELVLVDDGSQDDTWAVITELASENPNIKGIRLSRNFGKESAISAGLAFTVGDAVIVMDADLQHPPDLIPEMVRLWTAERWDIVEAVKEDRGKEPLYVSMRARLFYWFMELIAGLDIKGSSDFKLLDRRVVDAHNSLPESARFFRAIVAWLGFKRIQIPFSVKESIRRQTRWSLMKLMKLAINASTAFTSVPLHLVTFLGVITFAGSVILGIQTLYMKFLGMATTGFTTVILLQLFIGSVLMFSLGMIGIYLGRIFEEVKRRPDYIIKEKTNLG